MLTRAVLSISSTYFLLSCYSLLLGVHKLHVRKRREPSLNFHRAEERSRFTRSKVLHQSAFLKAFEVHCLIRFYVLRFKKYISIYMT